MALLLSACAGGGSTSSSTALSTPRLPASQAIIRADGGGSYTFAGGLQLDLYPGSLPGGTKITVSDAPSDAAATAAQLADDAGPEMMLLPFQINASAEPSKPVRLTITLAAEHRPANPDLLFLATYDSRDGWIPLDSQYEATTGVLSATLPHFSIFSTLAWLAGHLKEFVTSVLGAVFTPTLVPARAPRCDHPALQAALSFSPADDAAILHCADQNPDGTVTLRLVNSRAYAVGVRTTPRFPVTLVDADGGFANWGAQLLVAATEDGVKVLQSGKELDIALQPSAHLVVTAEPDGYSTAFQIAQAGIALLARVSEKLGKGASATIADHLGQAMDCGGDIITEARTVGAGHIDSDFVAITARTVFNCEILSLKKILGGIGGVVIGAISTIADIVVNLPAIMVNWVYDAVHGNIVRSITVDISAWHATTPRPAPPAPATAPPPPPPPPPTAVPTVAPTAMPTAAPGTQQVVEYNCDDLTPTTYKMVTVYAGQHWGMDIYPPTTYITDGHFVAHGSATVQVGIYYGGSAYPQGNNSAPVGPTTTITVNSSGSQYFTFSPAIAVPTTGSQYWFTLTVISGTLYVHDNPNELGECIIGTLYGHA